MKKRSFSRLNVWLKNRQQIEAKVPIVCILNHKEMFEEKQSQAPLMLISNVDIVRHETIVPIKTNV